MKRAICIIALLMFSISSSAHAVTLPDNGFHWNSFCMGIFIELQRQAEETNNQLQFDQSKRRLDNLDKQFLFFVRRKTWPKAQSEMQAWLNQGSIAAGYGLWDLPDVSPETNNHQMVIMLRAGIVSQCQSVADSAALYATAGAELQ
jgi:hypothetical protein